MKLQYLFIAFIFVAVSCKGDNDGEDVWNEDTDTSQIAEVDNTIHPVSWDDILNHSIDYEKTIVIEGYLGRIGSMVYESNGSMVVDIFPKRNQEMGERISFSMPIGTEKNHVHELEEDYLPEDFKLTTAEADTIQAGAKVKVQLRLAEVFGDEAEYYYEFISITKLEDAPKVDESLFSNAVELTDAIISDTTKTEVYGYMDGIFELPMMIFENAGKLRISFINKTNEEVKSVAIPIGDGPSTMNDLPEDFTEKDFVVRDFKGEAITGSNVRIYGTWHRSEFSNSGLFYLEEIAVR